MQIVYEFKIVGGGFDGAPGLKWLDDGKHPPPPTILVGVCGKGEHCGAGACRLGVAHITFWTVDEEGVPRGAQRYRKQDEHVARGGEDALEGHAVYAIGGLLDPRNFGAKAKELMPVGGVGPAVTAGFSPPPCFARPSHGGFPS